MPQYQLEGINVSFPFTAYDCQEKFMSSVIKALQRVYNAKTLG